MKDQAPVYFIVGFITAIFTMLIVALFVEPVPITGTSCSFLNVGLPEGASCVIEGNPLL